MQKYDFFKGTFILTMTGFLSRVIGFFYRILLSQTIGADGLGIYQLVFPIQSMFLALTASGIQTAISRFTAAHSAKNDTNGAIGIFISGTILSFLLSITTSFLLFFNRSLFGIYLLKEPRTISLLFPLALLLPLSALHGCISSYYYGKKETGLPSLILLLEQSVRILSFCLFSNIIIRQGRPLTPAIAMYGSLTGEFISVIFSLSAVTFCIRKTHFSNLSWKSTFSNIKEISKFALPLTANRVLLTLLSSIEAALIPQMLQKHGLSSIEALSQYGIFSGMVIPLLLFPATFTHSAATMLLPFITELQTLNHKKQIRHVIIKILSACLLMGTLFGFFYFLFGNFLGNFLFHQTLVGTYLRTISFICPVLYTNTTIFSILIGLGQPQVTLIHNTIVISLRILFVIFLIPAYGIQAYIGGILIAEFLLAFLNIKVLFTLNRIFKVDK